MSHTHTHKGKPVTVLPDKSVVKDEHGTERCVPTAELAPMKPKPKPHPDNPDSHDDIDD